MKEYKYIAVPNTVVAKKNKVDEAVNAYFDIINQESVEGWEFVTVAPINLISKKSAFKSSSDSNNVFIFAREKEEN